MKNTFMKIVVAASVAAFALIGPQMNKVEAAVKEDSLLNNGMPLHSIEQDNAIENHVTDLEEALPILEQPKVVTVPLLTPIIEPVNTQSETSLEPERETTEKEEETPAVSLSNEERDLFNRLVEAEAKGESYEGKVAVATVVLNRLDSPEFPNTVTEVITQVVGNSYAFSPVQNGEINKPASEEAKQAVEEAL